mmetsp:Transcript_82111/g.180490  ORF Transcript_82111/g.180490 Transcript_82111/m.180490 type:complete len:116 (-) Transcript_82111:8-355(-)
MTTTTENYQQLTTNNRRPTNQRSTTTNNSTGSFGQLSTVPRVASARALRRPTVTMDLYCCFCDRRFGSAGRAGRREFDRPGGRAGPTSTKRVEGDAVAQGFQSEAITTIDKQVCR